MIIVHEKPTSNWRPQVKQIENENPQIVLHLFRLVSHLSARRQELTIEQLAQLVAIMNAPSPRKPMTRASLANLRGKLV